VDSFDEYVDDLAIVFRDVRGQTGGLPLFLMGHSLGGLIASLFVVNHRPELHALILSSAALRIPPDLSPLKQKIVGAINRVAPRLKMGKLEIQHISRDETVQEAYLADPLTNNKGIRARVGFESLQAMKRVRQHPEAFTMPLYLFHGTADRITDPNGSKWLYEEAPSADKSLRLFDGLYHETMNEPERDEVLAELTGWVTTRI
jgi:alpha-beta hydrolase superfamily lysophospholipase